MKRISFILAFVFFGLVAAASVRAEAPARVQAHPATWQVTGKHGSAVLLGSQHLLPGNIDWMTPELEKTFADADVLVLEVPLDADTIGTLRKMMDERGKLPEGQTLRAMVPPDELPTFEKALTAAGLPEAFVADKRPWLAGFLIESMLIRKQMQNAVVGPDYVLMQKAQQEKKETRYLETAEQQLLLFAPEDPKLEMQFFLSIVHGAAEADKELEELSKAWAAGDVASLTELIERDSDDLPEFRAIFFTDRNKSMAEKIAAMLKENKKFLVVVGFGHMVGKDGIPALLRAKGFKVTEP